MAGTILNEAMLRVLKCPICHQAVVAGPEAATHQWLHCVGCGRYYPVQDGIPIMLEQRATTEPPSS